MVSEVKRGTIIYKAEVPFCIFPEADAFCISHMFHTVALRAQCYDVTKRLCLLRFVKFPDFMSMKSSIFFSTYSTTLLLAPNVRKSFRI